MRPGRILSTILALGLGAPAAIAADARPDFFPAGVETCFGREYDDTHLKAHPGQRVTSFHLWNELTQDPLREYEDESSADKVSRDREQGLTALGLLRLRDRSGVGVQFFTCSKSDAGGIFCGVDCDGGYFTGKLDGKGSLIVTNEGFQFEGVCDGGMDYLVADAEDKTFRLDPLSPAACLAERDGGRPSLAEGGEPLRVRFAPDTACFERSYDAEHLATHKEQAVAAIWLKKSGSEDFSLGVRLRDGKVAEAKASCFANTYSWSCFNPAFDDVDYLGPNNTYPMPSPAAMLVRAGADEIRLAANAKNLSRLLGVELGSGDDVFRLGPGDPASCGKR